MFSRPVIFTLISSHVLPDTDCPMARSCFIFDMNTRMGSGLCFSFWDLTSYASFFFFFFLLLLVKRRIKKKSWKTLIKSGNPEPGANDVQTHPLLVMLMMLMIISRDLWRVGGRGVVKVDADAQERI